MNVLNPENPSFLMRAWAVSLVAHGFAIAGAIWLVSEVKPVMPKEPFLLQIAFLDPVATQPVRENPTTTPPPPTPAVRPQPPAPTVEEQKRVVTEIRPIETKPVVETRPIAKPVQTIERPVETAVTPQAQRTPVEKTRTEEVVKAPGAIATERAVVSRETAVVAAVDSAPVERETVQSSVRSQVEHAPTPVQATPVQEARVRPDISKPADSPAAAPEPPSPQQPIVTEKPAVQTPAARSVPVHAAPGTRADYGWLKDLLARKIKEVKRYPHTARMNRLEGKVIVHAVIKEDGNLADVRIHESSGHESLDEAALQTMREACPLHMAHPLGRPQMAIRVPISYSLND